MICPYCKSPKTKVIDKREADGEKATRRRRECLKCKERFTTYERVKTGLIIVKRDGCRERFDRNKLKIGIMKACEKRPINLRTIEKLINDIESKLRDLHTPEIKSRKIGDLVMDKLKRLDKVAYVRFASYYKRFTGVESFKKALK